MTCVSIWHIYIYIFSICYLGGVCVNGTVILLNLFNCMKQTCCSDTNYMSNLTFNFNLAGNICDANPYRVLDSTEPEFLK